MQDPECLDLPHPARLSFLVGDHETHGAFGGREGLPVPSIGEQDDRIRERGIQLRKGEDHAVAVGRFD